jgi:hypothetical protein
VFDVFAPSYHWSFMQVEYATDLVFRSHAVLKPLYEQLSLIAPNGKPDAATLRNVRPATADTGVDAVSW